MSPKTRRKRRLHAIFDVERFNRCERKRRYNSERQAAAAARRIILERPAFVTEGLGAYKCDDCRQWHIGRARKRRP